MTTFGVDQTPVTPAQFAAAREFAVQFARIATSGGGFEVTLRTASDRCEYHFQALDGWRGKQYAVDLLAANLAHEARLISAYSHERNR